MPNTPTCIPKSLHTVRVLVVMARLIHRNRTISHRTAVHEAAGALGYSVLDDPYSLTEKAVKQLEA